MDLAIKQIDRDAAADLIEDQKALYVDGAYVDEIRKGGNDGNAIVEAFARHRHAAETAKRIVEL